MPAAQADASLRQAPAPGHYGGRLPGSLQHRGSHLRSQESDVSWVGAVFSAWNTSAEAQLVRLQNLPIAASTAGLHRRLPGLEYQAPRTRDSVTTVSTCLLAGRLGPKEVLKQRALCDQHPAQVLRTECLMGFLGKILPTCHCIFHEQSSPLSMSPSAVASPTSTFTMASPPLLSRLQPQRLLSQDLSTRRHPCPTLTPDTAGPSPRTLGSPQKRGLQAFPRAPSVTHPSHWLPHYSGLPFSPAFSTRMALLFE